MVGALAVAGAGALFTTTVGPAWAGAPAVPDSPAAPVPGTSLFDLVSRALRGDLPLVDLPTAPRPGPPAPSTTTTTLPVRADVRVDVTVPPPPTTAPPTTAPPAPPAPAPTDPEPANVQVGIASWYDGRRGTCAHRTAPIGTEVTVTNVATGASVTCTVTNRGPFVEGRVVDLDDASFAAIAPLSQGLADVRVEW